MIRVAYGGYLQGGAVYHSQCGEVLFTHIPGLRVVIPSNALDANGLLRTAIRCDDPVLFLEHKHLYRQTYNKGRYPGPDYMIPFGKAPRVRARDETSRSSPTAPSCSGRWSRRKQVEADGIEAEVLDLRSLAPYDWEAIAASVAQDRARPRGPRGLPVLGLRRRDRRARSPTSSSSDLDAPVRRVGALDTFVGYSPVLEDAILPQVETIATAIRELARY